MAAATAVLLLVVVVIAIVAVAGGGQASPAKAAAGSVGPDTALEADRGSVVYSANFSDPNSGWPTRPAPSDASATFSYGDNDYLIHGSGDVRHFVYPVFVTPVAQLSSTVTATQTGSGVTDTGFGVVCSRGSGNANVRYEFLLLDTSKWLVARGNGDGTVSSTLLEGTSPVGPGSTPADVVGMCATQADGQTNRLAMFVNGSKVADLTDTAVGMPKKGWLAGIVVSSRATDDSTVTVSHFTDRDLSR